MNRERIRRLKSLHKLRQEKLSPYCEDGYTFHHDLPIDKTLLLLQLAEEAFLRDMEIRAYDEHEIALLEIIQDLENLLDATAPKGRFFGSHPERHEGYLPFGYWPQEKMHEALPAVRKIAEVEERTSVAKKAIRRLREQSKSNEDDRKGTKAIQVEEEHPVTGI